ncbi:4-hydroxybenzoate octaprenyltransferase [Alkanindiges sp. WGS2144]|uniref:4-hydroxybenzoate octaprenyltransferase n=1 Tax=Alkanindiges sp. WGS2144 TaxID=3366808 RepID=UPI00375236CB
MQPSATSQNWQQRFKAYIQLTRFDKPIGTELLLWPTFWAVWIAANGQPSFKVVLIMFLGVLLMRAAGCAINDFADRKVDGLVERTKNRPLVSGAISSKEALAVFAVLVLLSASLLLFLPVEAFYWSFGALGLAALYPFTKRWTYLPQFVLGAAFSWAIPMAYVAQGKSPDLSCWLLYAANLSWTVAYDTQYAMTDRPDDLKIGVKSTAILFGKYDLAIIFALQVLSLVLLGWVFSLHHFFTSFMGGTTLVLVLCLFIYQLIKTLDRQPVHTFWAFRHNRWVGLIIWLGIILCYFYNYQLN